MISEKKYKEASLKVEELLIKTKAVDSMDHQDVILLDHYSEIVAEYEELHYPINKPGLIDVIKLRMYELGLKQKDLAELLEVPASRLSEYMGGKRDITLEVAKKLHHQLNIDGDIILQ
jgi:HTH-type transcriptional regulator/antitoxin HigA